jgi:hypothetical protein
VHNPYIAALHAEATLVFWEASVSIHCINLEPLIWSESPLFVLIARRLLKPLDPPRPSEAHKSLLSLQPSLFLLMLLRAAI